jgi:cytochrome c peroxidase
MKKYLMPFLLAIAIVVIQAYQVADDPTNKAELGKLLFFDKALSKDSTISCASCHKPEFAFADSVALSPGVSGRLGVRNTPSAMNLSLQRIFFWDGRAKNLEEQVLAPIENPVEMNLPIEEALLRLKNSKSYSHYFRKIFGNEPDRTNLAAAIASFERTLETSNSPFDNWKFSGNSNAVSDAVKRGFAIFSEKAKCSNCHFGADFTTREFRNIGLFNGKDLNDSGRIVISGVQEDIGKFKVPGLRNIAITSPYMHNGQFVTLRQVIDFYDEPDKFVANSINRDSLLSKPLKLTSQEKDDLEAFLNSLTDRRFLFMKKDEF